MFQRRNNYGPFASTKSRKNNPRPPLEVNKKRCAESKLAKQPFSIRQTDKDNGYNNPNRRSMSSMKNSRREIEPQGKNKKPVPFRTRSPLKRETIKRNAITELINISKFRENAKGERHAEFR